MYTQMVIEPAELFEHLAQGLAGGGLDRSEQGLQGAEQPFDIPVHPWTAMPAAPVANAECGHHALPEGADEHRFVVAADRGGDAVFAHGEQQVAKPT